MIEYTIRKDFLRKVLADTSSQPTAFMMFMKLLIKASVKPKKLLGRDIAVGQIGFEGKTMPEHLNCSRKQWKRDKVLLTNLHYIEVQSDGIVTIVTIPKFNELVCDVYE